jgi:hypothetical protein
MSGKDVGNDACFDCFVKGQRFCDCIYPAEQRTDYRKPTADQTFADAVWEVMDDIGNLLITKQLDYGPGNINNAHGGPINGLLVRIGDKFERLKNLFSKESKPNFESIEDSFKDLANYAVIGILIQKGKWPKQ